MIEAAIEREEREKDRSLDQNFELWRITYLMIYRDDVPLHTVYFYLMPAILVANLC